MKGIIFTGKQATGKSTLARILLSTSKENFEISSKIETRMINELTKFVLIEEISGDKLCLFKELITKKQLVIRKPYSHTISINVEDITLIGTTNEEINIKDFENCKIFNLS